MDPEYVVHYTRQDYTPDCPAIVRACNEHTRALLLEDDQLVRSGRGPSEHLRRRVVQLDEDQLVKFGPVHPEEFENQRRVREMLDPTVVTVPEIYCYFSYKSEHFLIMEYIKGVVRERVEDDESISRVADLIKYLQSFTGRKPGPLGGGVSRGLLWENEEIQLDSVAMLKKYFKRRTIGDLEGTPLDCSKLVLCHLDIAPRNIIWGHNGSICLIDWASAGFYPGIFEQAVLGFNTQGRKDATFTLKLEDNLGELSEKEKIQLSLTRLGWFNGHRYWM